jgi:hypothetical protein
VNEEDVRLILVTLAATIGLVAYNTELSFGFEGTAYNGLLSAAVVLLCGALFVASGVKKSKRLAKYAFALAFALAGSIGVADAVTSRRIETTKDEATAIIRALHEHYDACGRYPVSLEDLVPDRLRSIPRAEVSLFVKRDFWYRVDDDGLRYHLAFDTPAWHVQIYDSSKRAWRDGA